MRKIICQININTKATANKIRGINFTLISVLTVGSTEAVDSTTIEQMQQVVQNWATTLWEELDYVHEARMMEDRFEVGGALSWNGVGGKSWMEPEKTVTGTQSSNLFGFPPFSISTPKTISASKM